MQRLSVLTALYLEIFIKVKMNCFIVNLHQDVERRKLVTDDIKKNKLDFSIMEAVDGRILSDEDIKKYYNEEKAIGLFNRKLSLGEIGCALSHIRIYEKMASESIPSALILEDDICILDNKIDEILKNLEKIYPADVPVVVLLNYVERYLSNNKNIKIDNKYSVHDSYRGTSTSGYFITKAAAAILAKKIFPVYAVADKWEYFQKKFIPVKILIPNCIGLSEHSFSSTITSFGGREKSKNVKFNVKYYAIKHLKKITFALFERPFMKIKKAKNSENN